MDENGKTRNLRGGRHAKKEPAQRAVEAIASYRSAFVEMETKASKTAREHYRGCTDSATV